MVGFHLTDDPAQLERLLAGKRPEALELFAYFIEEFAALCPLRIYPAKTMIGLGAPEKRIAWIFRIGRNFVDIVFPFKESFPDNYCFHRIAQVPGRKQFNHHFRLTAKDDINAEVRQFMQLAANGCC